MDPILANEIARQVKGKRIGDWTITQKLGEGKSAVVMEANGSEGKVAIKLFDRVMVKRFGFDTQMERINRECLLIGKHHPNLVKIHGGGYWEELDLLYVVMEYVDAPSMEKVFTTVPKERIRPLVAQIASASFFLESLGLVHRDIKIDNICVLADFTQAKLMDLGVLRPMSGSDITDENGIANPPVTRRYCPPEYLSREEDGTVEGWRAITFYQLGGLLHDLIMGYRLFSGRDEPDDKLTESIKCYQPPVNCKDVDDDLCLLARACLAKRVETRLRLVDWERFREIRLDKPGVKQARAQMIECLAISRDAPQSIDKIDAPDLRESARTAATQLREHITVELTSGNHLPTLETRSSPGGSEGEWRLEFHFAPSRRFKRQVHISFVLWLTVLDASTQHVIVTFAETLDEIHDIDGMKAKATKVFDDLFSVEAARDSALQRMFATIGKALSS